MINYSVSQRRNPAKPEAPQLFYAQAQASGETTIKQMAARITDRCTVTRSDCVAVIDALLVTAIDALKAGEIVRLGDLGSLRVSLSSKGVESEDKFTPAMITKGRIIFVPGKELKEAAKVLEYRKVKVGEAVTKTPTKPEEESKEPDESGDTDSGI